jgi:hypothetical protein
MNCDPIHFIFAVLYQVLSLSGKCRSRAVEDLGLNVCGLGVELGARTVSVCASLDSG